MSSPLFLAIDFGSQSLRVCLIDDKGNIVLKEVVSNFHYLNPKPGFVEQECQWFLQQLLIACKNLSAKAVNNHICLSRISALGITTMRNTLFNLDENGQGLCRAIVWNDQRLAKQLPKLAWYWRLLFNIGNVFMPIKDEVTKMQASAFINHTHEHQLELWQKTRHLLLLSGYLQQQLTGKYVDSTANIIGYLPFNFKQLRWFGKYAWQYQALAVKSQWLPQLVSPGEAIGSIQPKASKELGLEQNIDVVACASDKACEVLGAGCYQDGQVHISLGSAVTVTRVSNKFVRPKAFYPAYPSTINGQYLTEFMLPQGLLLLTTFIDRNKNAFSFLLKDKVVGQNLEQLIEIYIKANKLSANGQVFDFNKVSHGEAIEQGFLHPENSDVFSQYIALVEAIIDGIYHSLKLSQQRFNSPVEQIVVTGGGANSSWLLQKLANKLKMQLHKPQTEQAGCLGVAITLAVNKGLYLNYQQAVKHMCRLDTVYTPA
ncbi:FGGY family carbohydrate kinase [Thalassomonas sp. M1454]|uniref:FGGY family carbohydrate kinase n=1 Tax=Thalassomonas sp. M1454 TaxID=2594477 RepID=UPI00117F1E25|nr:FGGY family carbohydrate kinase [Thalassomonas sp. M1454]TRX56746.1 hypothetical protein FNN08_04245 [Thalassomonas sp. M1454]